METGLNDRGLKLPPEQETIRAKCFHLSGTFVEFKEEEAQRLIPQRLEKIVQKIVRQLLDHTGNRAKRSVIAERVFKLTPEQQATSGTTK